MVALLGAVQVDVWVAMSVLPASVPLSADQDVAAVVALAVMVPLDVGPRLAPAPTSIAAVVLVPLVMVLNAGLPPVVIVQSVRVDPALSTHVAPETKFNVERAGDTDEPAC
jgi:hypothetical protein